MAALPATLARSSWRARLLVPEAALPWALGAVACSRLAMALELVGLARAHHTSVASLLVPWDASFYSFVAALGYPHHLSSPTGPTLAFFPLYPMLGAALSAVTRLPVDWSLMILAWLAAVAVSVLSALLVSDRYGVEAGRRAAVLVAVFPGSVIGTLTYADGLAVAFAVAFLLALQRRRFGWAGLAGAAAASTLSLLVAPVLAAGCWAVLGERRPRALLAPALTLLGPGGFAVFLWAWTGSPLSWSRAESSIWHAHLSLPWAAGTAFSDYALRLGGATAVMAASAAVAVAGLACLAAVRARGEWVIYCLVVLASALVDGSSWITPRYLLDAVPLVLALAVACRRPLFVPAVVISSAALLALVLAYTPPNYVFANP